MADNDLALLAHLMRRAGFGATREELEDYASQGYETVVENLLHPERFPALDDTLFYRYYALGSTMVDATVMWHARWLYRMINTLRPLEEKMGLFWHHVFATGWHKSENTPAMVNQIDMFRRHGLSNMRTILLELSRDPAMLDWLDNNENHKHAPNENYGRELLELFSMGVGNYSEQDIKQAARAFTGWTFSQPIPLYPYGYYSTFFEYNADDHDDSEKTFLGHTGRFNGEDIIDIIVQQSATPQFIARHMYNFFVADEPQVPAWHEAPPQDPAAIAILAQAYVDSDGDMRAILHVLFHADFFKAARFKRVKSPTELVAGTIRLLGTYRFPEPGLHDLATASTAMGQFLHNPPTVEGWHTGKEWIDGGTLTERVNFAVGEMADLTKPGIQDTIARLKFKAQGMALSPEAFVDACLDLMGPLEIGPTTRQVLTRYATSGGDLRFGTEADDETSARRIGRMMQLIASSQEYQFA